MFGKKIMLVVMFLLACNVVVCQEKKGVFNIDYLRQSIGYSLLFLAAYACDVKPEQEIIARLRSRVDLLESSTREFVERERVLSELLFQQQQLNLKNHKKNNKHRVLHLPEKHTHQHLLPGVSLLETVKEELENSESDHEN